MALPSDLVSGPLPQSPTSSTSEDPPSDVVPENVTASSSAVAKRKRDGDDAEPVNPEE